MQRKKEEEPKGSEGAERPGTGEWGALSGALSWSWKEAALTEDDGLGEGLRRGTGADNGREGRGHARCRCGWQFAQWKQRMRVEVWWEVTVEN